MTAMFDLLKRNETFASTFTAAEMPVLPKLRTIVLACVDSRVDPAHVLGLGLGDAVVIRNNGGRVTRAIVGEIAALAVMVARMTQVEEASFDLVLMQHTQCGAERFADPELQRRLAEIGVDVSENAITDQMQDLQQDLVRLRDAPQLPGSIAVSALLYDVKTGRAQEVAAPKTLADLRTRRHSSTNLYPAAVTG